jgi:hypothetical protein
MTAPTEGVLKLQQLLPEGALKIVAADERKDGNSI